MMSNEYIKENMAVWNSLKQPPVSALKKIKGGRLAGMTDIKPQWRYKVMTEEFGMCGLGWKYTIDRQWTEQGSDGQLMCFTNISLFFKDEEWSEAIPGTGGAALVAKETAGLHSSDEGYKMSLTDALSVAMTRIGVAADIYMGEWDGTKYANSAPSNDILDAIKKATTMDELKSVWTGVCKSDGKYTAAINARKSEL